MNNASGTGVPRTALAAIPVAVMLFALSQAAGAQALANQSVDDRLNMLMRVVDEQQKQINSLEKQVTNLEMAQRGRGLSGPAIGSDSTAAAGQPGADGLPMQLPPLPPLAQVSPGAPAPGSATGTATGVPVTPPTPDNGAGAIGSAVPAGPGALPAASDGTGAIGQTQKAAQPVRTQSEEAIVQQQQNSALFEHSLTFDWGISDTYYDRRQLQLSGFLALDAIFLGNINLGETKSHQVMADLDTRYGLTDRISVDVDVPYIYRHSNFIVGGAGGAANTLSDASANSSDIGDVNFGIYYQFLKETNNLPDVVGSLRVKAPTGSSPFGIKLQQVDDNNTNLVAPTKLPTGTGFWNITAGVSVLKTYDPVVLFGSLSYTYNVARSFADISSVEGQTEPATVKLGDIVQFGGGVALAFSDKDSASISYTMALEPESETRAPGGSYSKVPGSETAAAALNFGLNHVVNKHLTINGSVSVGLTPDAPNFVVGVRFPYTF
jgi:hypothetical protein